MNFCILRSTQNQYFREQKYASLTIFQFQEMFPDEESCERHLFELKWANGYDVAFVEIQNFVLEIFSIHYYVQSVDIANQPLLVPCFIR